jgi:hypothetical protein
VWQLRFLLASDSLSEGSCLCNTFVQDRLVDSGTAMWPLLGAPQQSLQGQHADAEKAGCRDWARTRVWVGEQRADRQQHLAHGQRGAPLVLQYVQADLAVAVYVAVVDACPEHHLHTVSRTPFRNP